jgi:hypothetical protein
MLGLRRHFDAGTEGVRAHAAECREPANRRHEESKRRYEELTRQWLLAEQRQRCARVERGISGQRSSRR